MESASESLEEPSDAKRIGSESAVCEILAGEKASAAKESAMAIMLDGPCTAVRPTFYVTETCVVEDLTNNHHQPRARNSAACRPPRWATARGDLETSRLKRPRTWTLPSFGCLCVRQSLLRQKGADGVLIMDARAWRRQREG